MKKIVSILTTLVLALQLVTVSAAGTPTVSVSDAEGFAGEKVKVTLDMNNVPYWSAVCFQIDYDTTALTMSKATRKIQKLDKDGNATLSDLWSGSQKASDYPYIAGWVFNEGSCTYNGTLMEFEFTIAENAAPGTYPVTVKYYGGSTNAPEDAVNYWEDQDIEETWEMYGLGLSYTNGSVTVKSAAPAEPTLAAAKTTDGVTITATHPTAITGKFIVAAYDADGLANVEVLDAAATATSTVKGDNVKVMWWDSLEGLNSIVPAVLAE